MHQNLHATINMQKSMKLEREITHHVLAEDDDEGEDLKEYRGWNGGQPRLLSHQVRVHYRLCLVVKCHLNKDMFYLYFVLCIYLWLCFFSCISLYLSLYFSLTRSVYGLLCLDFHIYVCKVEYYFFLSRLETHILGILCLFVKIENTLLPLPWSLSLLRTIG